MFQRDAFISIIHEAAKRDRSIYFLSADLGAPALDAFRSELPEQFIHMGISEQNMISVATGLALEGAKVYVYAMSPFFLRCAEQLKLASIMGIPLTVVSVGGGLGYAGSGPSHYALEDIALYRTLRASVYTASDETLARALAEQSLLQRDMMVCRLERSEVKLYDTVKLSDGFTAHPGRGEPIVTCGYLVDWFLRRGHPVYDVFRVKPVSMLLLLELADLDNCYTFEEQFLPGGFGSAIIEALADYGKRARVFRRGVPERAIIENGTRDQLLEGFWFSTFHHPV